MGKRQEVPITGSVLRWAIDESGLSDEEVARRVGISPSTLLAWEEEEHTPSKTQFSKLVSVLQRPSTVFFLENPPESQPVQALFRAAPGTPQRYISPAEAKWIRQVDRLQDAVSWIMPQLERDPPELPLRSIESDPEVVALEERNRLGISIEDQINFSTDRQALQGWQASIEHLGVFVLNVTLGEDAGRGFAVWNPWAPTIAINTSYWNTTGRIYTLAHEYGHLLTRTVDLSNELEEPVDARPSPAVERWCERFAAALLLPRDHLIAYARDMFGISWQRQISDPQIVSKIANRYHVSLRATALRLIELGLATRSFYEIVVEYAKRRERKPSGGGGGERTPERRIRQYGRAFPLVFLESVDHHVISRYDVMEYLDVTSDELDEVREVAARRVVA